jgi:hypothetical protein
LFILLSLKFYFSTTIIINRNTISITLFENG